MRQAKEDQRVAESRRAPAVVRRLRDQPIDAASKIAEHNELLTGDPVQLAPLRRRNGLSIDILLLLALLH